MSPADRSVYGSERHLLRYLGRHRAELDRRVCEAAGAGAVEWLDFPFDVSKPWLDGEWKGLDFLPESDPARAAWRAAWPARGNPPNWDAVGRLRFGDATEWLLVEAKANIEELRSSCAADPTKGGLRRIAETLDRVKAALGVEPARDWLNGYYQLANRLAALHLMIEAGTPARLLLVHFCGDRNPGLNCPPNPGAWNEALAAQDRHLGIGGGHALSGRVHKLFLDVAPVAARQEAMA